MKNVRFIIFLLLVPFAFLLASCDNSVPEELQMEVREVVSMDNLSADQILDGIEYFDLIINKGFEDDEVDGPIQPIGSWEDFEDIPPVFEGRVYRGEYLRIEGLEPGKYRVLAFAGGDPDICEFVSVDVESNNMDEYGNIIIERGVPVLIKLHIDYYRA